MVTSKQPKPEKKTTSVFIKLLVITFDVRGAGVRGRLFYLHFYLILCEWNWTLSGSICGRALLVNTSESILAVFTLQSDVIYARDRCVHTRQWGNTQVPE